MENLIIFLGMALATFFTRYAMIAALGKEVPPLIRRWLHYVPPAILASLVAPAALAPEGRVELGYPVWALLVGVVVAWRTRNVLWTILGGLSAFWLLRWLIAGSL